MKIASSSAMAQEESAPLAASGRGEGSIHQLCARPILPLLVLLEHLGDLRVAQGFTRLVRHQILLRNVGNILSLCVLGEQVIERLIFPWSHLRGYRLIPFLRIGEFRVDVEHDSSKRKQAMSHHLADLKTGMTKPRTASHIRCQMHREAAALKPRS